MNQKFSRKQRLLSFRDYQCIYRRGKKYIGKYVIIFYRVEGEKGARLGITIARKWGTSPERSRFKRIVRAAYRSCALTPALPLEMNVHPRPAYQKLAMQQVKRDMQHLIEKVSGDS